MNEIVVRKKVSVLGLGAMGSTLARSLMGAGHEVAVWNRTQSRARNLIDDGATDSESAEHAVASSPLLVFCMIDKGATEAILRQEAVAQTLEGRTIVNLSTGSADDARRIGDFVRDRGGRYLDGGIMAYPRDIGKPTTTILYSGDADGFAEHRAVLVGMAGNAEFLGEDPGTASVLYLALYAYYFGAVTAFLEGAALAERAHVEPETFRRLSAVANTMLADGLADITCRIAEGNYAGDQATIDVHYAGQLVVRDAYINEGIGYETTRAYLHYLEQVKRSGNGHMDIAALYAVVKQPR
jgi:3-hydroxyisobutyrate dehydrogenase-like beta-hydroxyacid dehydrogenase